MAPPHEFRWLVHLFFPGLFDGEHIFELEEIAPGSTKFIQREEFKGLLVSIFWKTMRASTLAGFEKMNETLKEKVERR